MRRIIQFIYLLVLFAVVGLFFALGLVFFVYLFLIVLAFAVVMMVVRGVREWWVGKKKGNPKKPASPKGRIIDSDDWKQL